MRKAIMGRDAVISALGTPARSFEGVTLLSTASQASYRPSRCTAAGTTSRF
ncbi:hypothetical protein ACVIKP_000027 [Rhizobium leguminosarum]